jgi:acyl-CoA reductase-like NAD-dependent aldehyde dehydrogenase
LWAEINVINPIVLAEETTATTTAGVLSGSSSDRTESRCAGHITQKEPHGVMLAIVPWDEPLILGLRAVAAAVAAGNTVVLKVGPTFTIPMCA